MNVDLGIWSKLTRVVMVLLVLAAILAVVLWYRPLIHRNQDLRRRILDLEAQVHRGEQENRKLEALINALQHDPETVERVVRQRLNWARPDETVIRFEELARPRAAGQPDQAFGSTTR